MSILYDDDQQAIATAARRVAQATVDKERLLAPLEETGRWDERFWNMVVEQGWTALAIPEEHGGLGLGLVELGIIAEVCGEATAGAPFLTFNDGAAHALIAAGAEQLAARWLPKLASGEATAALAFAEERSLCPQTPSVKLSGGRLSGTKRAVAGGTEADFAVVTADSGGALALAVVELGEVERTPVNSFDNGRLYADLTFTDADAQTLAEGEAAEALLRRVLARAAVVTAHEQLGGAEALLRTGRDYAVDRRAFGQPIGAFQSVKHRLAELYVLIEIARANCMHASSREGEPDFVRAAAAARLSASEAYDTAARDIIQIHGGIGVTWEGGLHLHMRRARSLTLELGNMPFWEDLLARELTGTAA